ncbi:MAG: hypothetical protein LYZ66_04275 [Nitrososphaerales archaeon]|nr:hypothetical protein [Nitrososphaerales archaeon]
MDVRKFSADVNDLARKACRNDGDEVRSKVLDTAAMLVGLYKKNLVKINHSALELVCARSLIKQGYDVKVEHRLNEQLVCDVFGRRGDGALIVEIETGFIPPEAALEPQVYAKSRIASKIARYSKFAGNFALGTTPSYVLDFAPFFVKPPGERTAAEAAEIKKLTDIYYDKPPISLSDLTHSRVHSVFIIDVDDASTEEVDPAVYVRNAEVFTERRSGNSESRSDMPVR